MKQIKIDIPKGYEIDIHESNISEGHVKFRKCKDKYPKSVDDLYKIGTVIFDCYASTKERVTAIDAFLDLLMLRDEYNRIDNFVPDWTDEDFKYQIFYGSYGIAKGHIRSLSCVLSFKTATTRDLFMNRHIDLLEKAKDLI